MAIVYTANWDTASDVTLESFADWDYVDYSPTFEVLAANKYPTIESSGDSAFYANNNGSIPTDDAEINGLVYLPNTVDAYAAWLFRWTDPADDGYMARAHLDNGHEIFRFDSGGATSIADDNETVDDAVETNLRGKIQGTSIEIQWGSNTTLTQTDANHSSGEMGIAGYRANTEIRSFQVDDLVGVGFTKVLIKPASAAP